MLLLPIAAARGTASGSNTRDGGGGNGGLGTGLSGVRGSASSGTGDGGVTRADELSASVDGGVTCVDELSAHADELSLRAWLAVLALLQDEDVDVRSRAASLAQRSLSMLKRAPDAAGPSTSGCGGGGLFVEVVIRKVRACLRACACVCALQQMCISTLCVVYLDRGKLAALPAWQDNSFRANTGRPRIQCDRPLGNSAWNECCEEGLLQLSDQWERKDCPGNVMSCHNEG